ncbi:MAG TPA: LuxR C-terminal-related transcriptional regulator [Actinopolymorphaceae bacterium]
MGRRAELAEVRKTLSGHRMVTLTGVGGVGKTRLAQRAAAGLHRAFRDGIWLVDLTRIAEPASVEQAVIETLQIHDQTRRDGLLILADHLRDRHLLLILDNCEHLLGECAVLADTLLRRVMGVRILATSRQPLNIANERVMPVLPLPIPDSEESSTLSAKSFGAVELFVERATAVQHDFRLTPQNRAAIVGICRRLDGIPLAIELAAARLRTLTPEQILKRLDHRYRLLTTGARSAPARHQTLQALIDWSFERMSRPEQLLWMRSSMFAGSFDLTAAEAVCSGDGIEPDEVIDLIGELVDKSILVREEHEGVARYRQLDTLREYGRRRLEAEGDEATIRRRHRDYYLQVAAQSVVKQFAPEQAEWYGKVQQDYPDLRAAMEYCLASPGEGQHGLRMAADLLYHWIRSYYLNEGRRFLDRLLASETEASVARADALWTNSWLAIIQGDLDAARRMLAEARQLAEQLDARRSLAYVELFSGFAAMYEGDTQTALRHYEAALERHRELGNPHGMALTLIRLSLAHSYCGDSDLATAHAQRSLELSNGSGEIWHKAFALMALGVEAWRRGDFRRAVSLEQESLRLSRKLDTRLGMSLNVEVLAWIAASAGRWQRAAKLLGILQTLKRSTSATLSGYGHLAPYHEQCVERVKGALGESYDTAFEAGSRLDFDHALAYALQEKERHPGHARAPRSDMARLTRRERETAQLVAEGRTNKEIAAALVIAQRTAEAHVENILVKLGFTSRAQIAAWVAAQRDLDD